MRRIIGQSVVAHIAERFDEFSGGGVCRVFLWDPGNGYPNEDGDFVPLEELTKPMALVRVEEAASEAITLASNQPAARDVYQVSVTVYPRPPEEDPYEFDELPDRVHGELSTTAVAFFDFDEDPAVLVDTAVAEKSALIRTDVRAGGEPLFLYHSLLRAEYVFYREAASA